MYSGDYRISLDDRGRMRIPSKLREKLGKDFVMSAGTDGCAFLMNEADFETLIGPITRSAKLSEHEKMNMLRKFYANVYTMTEDNQGRFVLPAKLKAYMKASKGLVFVGMLDRIEVWSEEIYDERFSTSVEDINNVVDMLGI